MGLTINETNTVVEALGRAEAAHAAWAYYQGGADDDWASFYARFLVEKSPMPQAFTAHFPKGLFLDQVIVALRATAIEHLRRAPEAPWAAWYATHLDSALHAAADS